MAPAFKSPLTPIFLIVAVEILGYTIMIPLLPFYAEEFGASAFMVGLLFSSYSVCMLFSGPILGRVSDSVGRRPTLILSQIGTMISFIILGFAGSLWVLFLGRIIDGFTAGNLTVAQAYISDVTKPEERTKAFGLIGMAFGLGFVVGPVLSGFLSQFGYHVPFFFAAGLSLTAILCSLLLLPKVESKRVVAKEKPDRMEQFTRYFTRPIPRRRLIEYFMFLFSFSILISGFALFLGRRMGYDAEGTGYIFAFSGVIGLIIQGVFLGKLVAKVGERRLAIYGFITMAISYAFLGAAYELPLLLLLVLIGAFGSSVIRPSLTTLLTGSVGRHEQGAVLGVGQSLASIAQILGPLLATWLIELDQLALYGIAAASASIIGLALSLTKEPAAEPDTTETLAME